VTSNRREANDGAGNGRDSEARLGLRFCERLEQSTEQLEDLDTARLVTRIQAGDKSAFPVLYDRYFDRVYGYLRVLLKDRHEAEDAAQQVFMKMLEALPGYERRSQPFRAWIFVLARNLAISHLRKHGRNDVVDPAKLNRRIDRDPEEDPATMTALQWVSDHDLTVLIERLPVSQRQVLTLRYMMDLSTRQIAEILDRNENEVRMLQHRAQRFLRDRLTSLGREPKRGGRVRWRGRVRQAVVLRERRFALRP
jgi:RNA polymerase sigma-70 factor (ECF subfamily)